MVHVLIVDGYNVIRSTAPYAEMAERDLERARDALLADVAAYAANEARATVVFDGGGNPLSDGSSQEFCGIEVVFSPHGQSADTVVEARARRARDSGHDVEVVSSDAATQWAVMGASTVRRSAREFATDLRLERSEYDRANPCGPKASRVEDRIEPGVRDALRRMIGE